MNVIFVVGRIAFVLIFILSGAQKLMDIPGTAKAIGSKIILPEFVTTHATQLETATGMTTPTMLAIATGIVEVGAALMIAANIGTRAGAVLLILFTIATIYYFHPFWTMTGAEREANMINALKNVSLIGGLMVFFVLGSWRPSAYRYDEQVAERL